MISSFPEAGTLIPRLPHRRSCFFKQPQFERLFGHDLLQLLGLAPEVLDFTIGRRPGRVPGRPALAGFQELFRPPVIQALGNAFAPAQLGDRMPPRAGHPAPRGPLLQPNTACGSPGGCLSQPARRTISRSSDFCSPPLLDVYGEPEILRSSSRYFSLTAADVGQASTTFEAW